MGKQRVKAPSTLLLVLLLLLSFFVLATSARHIRRGHQKRSCAPTTLEECNKTCTKEPSASDLERQLSSPMDLHMTFYQFPPLLDTTLTLEKFKAVHAKKGLVDIHYSNIELTAPSCEETAFKNATSGTRTWDPCPLRWQFNHDAKRIPMTLVEADCIECDHCKVMATPELTSTKLDGVTLPQESVSKREDIMKCAPVKMYTKVLRRTCECHSETDEYIYVTVWEPVTVSCACRPVERVAIDPSKCSMVRTEQ